MICSSCRLDKPIDAFGLHPLTRSGRQSQCRSCAAEGAKRRRAARRGDNLSRDMAAVFAYARGNAGAWLTAADDARTLAAIGALANRGLVEIAGGNHFRLKA